MKQFVISFSLLLLVCSVFAQVHVKGIVTEANTDPSSGIVKKALPGVEIKAKGAVAPEVSDDGGRFRLVFNAKKIGEKVSIKFIKAGYEVFNSEMVDTLVIPEDRSFMYLIKLCPVGTIDRLFQERRDNQLQILNQKYQQEKKKLDQTKLENARYNKQLKELQEKLEANQRLIDQYAKQFARIDFDDMCELYRKAYSLFEKGELDSVTQVLSNTLEIADNVIANGQENNLSKQQTEELLKLAAKNYTLNGFDYNNATIVYKKLLALDSTKVNNLIEYAQFAESQNKFDEAIIYYSKAFTASSNDGDRAKFLNELGILKSKLNYPLKDISETYIKALDLLIRQDTLGVSENRDVISVFFNFGNFQKEMHCYTDAEKSYLDGVNLVSNIILLYNDDRDKLFMARYLTELGCLRMEMRKLKLAEKDLVDALNIFRTVPTNDSLIFQADFIHNLNCIGRLNLLQDKTAIAEYYFNEALNRSKACMKLNSLKYMSPLSMSLCNMGQCKSQMNDFENAERCFGESLSITKKLKEAYSKTNDFQLSNILLNYARFKTIQNQQDRAEQYFLSSLKIRRELALKKPEVYTASIIEVLNELSKVYIQTSQYHRAEGALLESLSLCYKLNFEWVNEYDIEIFETYKLLSDLSVKVGDTQEASIYLNESLCFCNLLQTKGLYGFESEKNTIIKEIESNSKNKKKQVTTKNNVDDNSDNYAEWMGNLSYFLILDQKFDEAEFFATKALNQSPTQIWIKTNLALSLLLQGKFKEAKLIYIELKDQDYPFDKNKKFKEVFLTDLDEIEAKGIRHPDVTKIRSILLD